MGVKPTFKMADIKAQLAAAVRRIDRAIFLMLSYLGEQAVKIAREKGDYRDVTGNLRSSIGYVIAKNGKVMKANFERNLIKTDPTKRRRNNYGKDGVAEGERFARSLVAGFGSGWVLIVVAGMAYAAKVESRGRDVLTSAKQYSDTELPGLLRDLKQSVDKMRA